MTENSPASNLIASFPPLSRRALLGGIGVASLAALVGQAWRPPAAVATSAGTVLPLVDALPAGAPDRALFAPNEQVFASYLMILAPLANSVVDDDPERYGWMEDGWWRTPNEPFNARIMEHVATMSWFYSHERAWNPYYLDENLLGRLDAALGHYLSLQHEDGSYPEYAPEEHHLSPTGFGTVAQAAVLRDLRDVDVLPHRRAGLETAVRASSAWLMDLASPHWELPVKYANQVVAGLAGVAQTADVLEDPTIAASLSDRMAMLLEHGQAPAGCFNELYSADFGYNFTVMLADLGQIYSQSGDPSAVELARRFARWLSYQVLPEPGRAEGFVVAAHSARGASALFTTTPRDDSDRNALARALLDPVPELGAFFASAEEKNAARAEWASSPEPVAPRKKQDTSPRLYVHVPVAPDGIPSAERDQCIAELPHMRTDTLTELRTGTLDQQFVFVRRPGYYATALYGVRAASRQRTGTGTLWHPDAGTFVLSLNNAGRDYWSTITDSGTESGRATVSATHHVGESAAGAEIEAAHLTGFTGLFTTRYVTEDGIITTDVSHWHDSLRRVVNSSSDGVESIPFMLSSEDDIVFDDGTAAPFNATTSALAASLSITRGGVRLIVAWSEAKQVKLVATDRVYFDGSRRHHVLEIPFSQTVTTEFSVVDAPVADSGVRFHTTGHTVHRDGMYFSTVHVINMDSDPIDVRIATTAGTRTFRDLAPFASGHVEFRNSRLLPAPGLAIATTCGSGKVRVASNRLTV